MAPDALAAWVRLSLVPGLTGTHWRRLLAAFGTPLAVFASGRTAVKGVLEPQLAAAVFAPAPDPRLDAALAWANQPGHAILTLEDATYPALLKETPDPPPLLYAAGRIELTALPAVAVVGSRNATAQGMRNAEAFARELAAAGVCVVSGLAIGIDAAAHRGALVHDASSIAVVGNGIDVAYPRRNTELYSALAERGLILSEFTLGTPPLAPNFPRRNRIIGGLARGCLVVEAALASGSLITARLAADMGRDVYAIPGSIHSPLSRGCHRLIKQGAKLVETVQDVLDELGVLALAAPADRPHPVEDPPETRALFDALGDEMCDVDTLHARTRMPVDRLLALLLALEIDGRVSRHANGHYQRVA